MTTTNLRTLHRILAVIALATLAGTLAGCSHAAKPVGGQTAAAAHAALAALPGVTEAEAGVDDNLSGFTHTYTPTVSITIDPAFTVADPAALTSYLVETAWSLNDKKPSTLVSVSVIGTDADLGAAAVQGGWLGQDALSGSFSRDASLDLQLLSLTIADEPTKSKLGAWPGKVPTLPDGVLVKK